MKNWKKWIAAILALLLLFSLSACGKKPKGEGEKELSASEQSDARLPYSREDGINPYTAKSLLNEPIMPLLYQGLYYLDSTYREQPEIADHMSQVGTALTVTLSDNAVFSDGSKIDAGDVVYSFQKAKKSTYYSGLLTTFRSATEESSNAVTFEMTNANRYAVQNLTFPVVKQGTADKGDSIPTGSGQYKYSVSDMGGMLEKNKECKQERTADGKHRRQSGSVNKVYLSNIAETTNLMTNLAIGNINAVFDDLAAGPVQRVQVNYCQQPMNNIVILKFGSNETLQNAKLRQDISVLLDRSSLISIGLNGYGKAADLPFQPRWYATKGIRTAKPGKDRAKLELQKAFKGKTLSILTDADNPFKQEIASELQDELQTMGIRTTISAQNYSSYTSAANGTGYDLILAEYKLNDGMDLSAVMPDKASQKVYANVINGKVSLKKFAAWYQKHMPFITIGYRGGMLAYSKDLKEKPNPLPGDPYADVSKWQVQ